MAALRELEEVVRETLDRKGVLNDIKGHIRAEIANVLDDPNDTKPSLSNENLLVNELIREYLEFNKYKHTTSVLLTESGQPKTGLDREFLENELNVRGDAYSSHLPLLYSVVSYFSQRTSAHRRDRDNEEDMVTGTTRKK